MPARPSAAQSRRFVSFRDRLHADLDEIAGSFEALLDGSTIVTSGRSARHSAVVLRFADWQWGASADDQLRLRTQLELAFNDWWARFELLFDGIQHETRERIDKAWYLVYSWIVRGQDDISIPSSIPEAKALARDAFDVLRSDLDLLSSGGYGGVIAIPDTGALIDAPDLAQYAQAVGASELRIIVPTKVVAELDHLKDQSPSPDTRANAQAVIRRFKGLRDKGDITVGTSVTKSISLTLETREPSFKHLPEHLDPSVPDDRILAAALGIQARYPAAIVVMVAGDLNLQTKAHVLGLPFVEPPIRVG